MAKDLWHGVIFPAYQVVVMPECFTKSFLAGVLEITHSTSGAVARLEACSPGMQAAPEFNPQVRHILSWRLGQENISKAILPLPLIQEEQLSVTCERMCTKYMYW